MLFRSRDAFPDAPDKTYVQREVELSPEQKRLYTQMKKELRVATGDQELSVKNALEKALRLQQIVGGHVAYLDEQEMAVTAAIDGPNPKVAELLDMMEEIPGSVVIWCAFVPEILMVAAALRKAYGDEQVVELHGAIDEAERDRNVNVLFQSGTARFLVANASVGGMGLSMYKADTEVFFSNSFNYTDREQAEARAFAPGKPQGTLIVDLIATGTIDEHIHRALTAKKSMSEYIRDSIENIRDAL